MVRIQESTMSQAMQFVMDTWFPDVSSRTNADEGQLLRFDDSVEWRKNNPTTGKIFLNKYPLVKQAWVLVKFTELKNPNYGKTTVLQDHKTIRSIEEFREFFGVTPTQGFKNDMVIVCRWNKQEQQNKNTSDRFDETTPDFYMYINHTNVNPEKIVNRLSRIKQAMDKLGVGNETKLYNLPYYLTDLLDDDDFDSPRKSRRKKKI